MIKRYTMKGLELDYETADRITLLTLIDHRDYLVEELRAHEEDGQYLHPEDAYKSKTVLIPALDAIIDYYGGSP